MLALLAWFASVITYSSTVEFESDLLANAENMFTIFFFTSSSKRIVMNCVWYVFEGYVRMFISSRSLSTLFYDVCAYLCAHIKNKCL